MLASVKIVHLLWSSHIEIYQQIGFELFWTAYACNQCFICAYFSLDSERKCFFFSGETNIMDRGLISVKVWRKQRIELKNISNLSQTASQDINWWIVWITCVFLWYFYQLYGFSSDGTHSLQRSHWWAGDAIVQIWSDEKKSTLGTPEVTEFSGNVLF